MKRILKLLCKVLFVGRLSLKMFWLKKFCDLAKNFLCNFDPYAYHYVFISIVKCPVDWREIFMKQSVGKWKQINF